MADPIRLGITIRADGSAQVSGELNRVRDSVSGAGNAVQGTNRQFADMASTMSRFSAILGGLTFAALARDILNVNREMETLRATLKSVTGSAANGAAAFAFIQEFAKNTPYDIQGLTQTFIKLKGMGLEPTAQVMDALTNQSSKLGGSQETLSAIAAQLGQAYSKQKLQQEDLIVLAERGVPVYELLAEVTGKNGAALSDLISKGEITRDVIDQLIIKMGELASGSNAQAIDTLNGAISNLSDAWHTFEDTLLNDQSEGLIRTIVSGITESINTLTATLGSGISNEIETLKNMAITKKAFLGQFGIEADTSSTDALVAKLTATKNAAEEEVRINQESAKLIKQTEDWLAEATEQTTKKQLASHATRSTARTAASRAIASAISEEERAERKHEETVKQVMLALQAKNQQLSQTAEQYYRTSLAAKGLTDEEIVQAERINAANQRLEEQKTHNDELKSAMDGLIDKYNQLTLSARDYYSLQLTNKGIAPAQQAPLLAQFDKNDAAQAAIDAQKASMEQLKALSSDLNSSMQDLGATTLDVFQASVGGASQLVGALEGVGKTLQANAKAYDVLAAKQKANASIVIDKNAKDYAEQIKIQAENKLGYEKEYQALQAKTTNDALNGVMLVAGETAQMFAGNKTAAIAYQAVSLGVLAVQAAIAVAEQGKGDPYTAFARIAAMTATMAALVASVGGGGGNVTAPVNPSSASTGSVLGDKTASSESINNVYELLKNIHAEEYAELRGINKGVAALKDGILGVVTKTFQTGAITGTEAPHLGQSKYTLVAGGIATASASLADILSGVEQLAGQMFTTEAKLTSSSKKGASTYAFTNYFTKMDANVQRSIGDMFQDIGKTMADLSGTLGKQIGKDLSAKFNAAVIPAMTIDIMGLNGDDAVKKVNAVISTTLDNLATQVFGDIISQYQKLGEGMLETAIRIVAEVAVVKDALATSGVSMAGNAIALADSLVQAAGGLEEFQKQFEAFYDKFYTDAEKQARLTSTLKSQLGDLFPPELVDVILESRDNYRLLVSSLNLINAKDQERYSLLIRLSQAADQYYTALADGANNAYQAIIDAKTKADDELSKATQQLDTALQNVTKLINEQLAGLEKQRQAILTIQKNTDTAYATYDKLLKDNLTKTIDANNKKIALETELLNKLSPIIANIDNALQASVVTSAALTRAQRANAQRTLASALASDKSITEMPGLDKALSALSQPSTQLFKSYTDYARDQAKTSALLLQVQAKAQGEQSPAQQTVDELKQANVDAQTYYDDAIGLAKSQVDAVRGIDESAKNIDQAFANLNKAVVDEASSNAAATISSIDAQKTILENQLSGITEQVSIAKGIDISAKDISLGIVDVHKAIKEFQRATLKAAGADEAVKQAEKDQKKITNQATARANLAIKVSQADDNLTTVTAGYNTNLGLLNEAKNRYIPSESAPSTFIQGQSGNAIWEQVLGTFQTNFKAATGRMFTEGWSSSVSAALTYKQLVNQYDDIRQGLINKKTSDISKYEQWVTSAQSSLEKAETNAKEWHDKYDALLAKQGHATGLKAVPYDGYQATLHKGEGVIDATAMFALKRYFNARPQSTSSGDNDKMIQEIKQLRAELLAANVAIAKNTQETAKILRKFDGNGMPEVREG